jgi:hypothetical protein
MRPSDPITGLTHYVQGSPLVFDFNDQYVQSPACGYAYTSSFTWTGVDASLMSVDSDGALTVYSADTILIG